MEVATHETVWLYTYDPCGSTNGDSFSSKGSYCLVQGRYLNKPLFIKAKVPLDLQPDSQVFTRGMPRRATGTEQRLYA